MTTTAPSPAFAVIDGALCELGRFGGRTVWHAPLATAVAEFRRGPFRTFVREQAFGLLPGLPNLYCLDSDQRLLWMAEWPLPADPCVAILDENDEVLTVQAASGALVRLDVATGRLISWTARVAVAS